ncbi:MAG: hypothetical protein ACKN9U_04865, partial [Pirellulaceae bacterium]
LPKSLITTAEHTNAGDRRLVVVYSRSGRSSSDPTCMAGTAMPLEDKRPDHSPNLASMAHAWLAISSLPNEC